MTQTDLNGTNNQLVYGVTYNAAGQMTYLNSDRIMPETRQYNSLGQLTNITAGSFNISYNYTAGQNNGKIASQTDNLSGETVTYAYDTLNRLISAQGSISFNQPGTSWGQGFQYDPFGNLSAKTVLAGSAPTWSAAPDVTTNHVGPTDANGNSSAYGWDAENRLVASAAPPASSYTRYAYDGQNKQIWSCAWNASTNLCATDNGYSFYSPTGKLLGTFGLQFTPYYQVHTGDGWQTIPDSLTITNGTPLAYFGSRLLVTQDRLGSQGRFFPYGEDRTSVNYPQTGQVWFATYADNGTGLYYADQRWYSASPGRFLSPDPYQASAGPRTPQSWNRYAYVLGDPANLNDPFGLDGCMVSFTGMQTGPPSSCNSIGYTAWSVGLDNWVAPPSGISQTGTISQVDPGDADNGVYSQNTNNFFWGTNWWSFPCAGLSGTPAYQNCLASLETLSGGALTCAALPFTSYICVPTASSPTSPDPPSTNFPMTGPLPLGGTVISTIIPQCPAGYVPTSDLHECVPSPGPPFPPGRTSRHPIRPPNEPGPLSRVAKASASTFARIVLVSFVSLGAGQDPPAPKSTFRELRFSPSGQYVLAQDDSAVTVLTVEPFRLLFRIPAEGADLSHFTPDSSQIVFVGSATRVDPHKIALANSAPYVEHWYIAHQTRVGLVTLPALVCGSEELSPDGSVFVCLDLKSTLRFIDVASGRTIFEKKDFTWLFRNYDRWGYPTSSYGELGSARIDFSPNDHFVTVSPRNAAGRNLIWNVRDRTIVYPKGRLKKLKEYNPVFIASDRILMRFGAAGKHDLKRGVANAWIMEFPSGRLLSESKIPLGFFYAATSSGFIIIRPFGGYAMGVSSSNRAAAVELSTGLVIISDTPALDVFGRFYVAEPNPGVVGLYEIGKGLKATVTLYRK